MIDYKKKYLLRLKKRRDFLAQRTANRQDLSYDLAEMNALNWAIETLAEIYKLDEYGNQIKEYYDVDMDGLETH